MIAAKHAAANAVCATDACCCFCPAAQRRPILCYSDNDRERDDDERLLPHFCGPHALVLNTVCLSSVSGGRART